MKTAGKEPIATKGWKSRAAASLHGSAYAIALAALLAGAGISVPAFAEDLTTRFASMTGVWTGPPLDEKGVPEGFILRDDILIRGGPGGLPPPPNVAPTPWPDGVIPFQFDANVTAANRTLVLAAMDEWMRRPGTDQIHVAFVQRNGDTNHVHIMNHASLNNSSVGMVGGAQIININDWSKFTIAHELGHAMGLPHEQCRPDRDTYVTIHPENMEEGVEHNFDIVPNWMPGTLSTPYDFSSVMHYGRCAGSAHIFCSLDATWNTSTIVPKSGVGDYSEMGQTSKLSDSDVADVWNAYGKGGSGFADHRYGNSTVGTYASPFKPLIPGAQQHLQNQGYHPGARLWVQGGHYPETGRIGGPQKIRAMPGTGTVRIGP
jgi:hypothetical protein